MRKGRPCAGSFFLDSQPHPNHPFFGCRFGIERNPEPSFFLTKLFPKKKRAYNVRKSRKNPVKKTNNMACSGMVLHLFSMCQAWPRLCPVCSERVSSPGSSCCSHLQAFPTCAASGTAVALSNLVPEAAFPEFADGCPSISPITTQAVAQKPKTYAIGFCATGKLSAVFLNSEMAATLYGDVSAGGAGTPSGTGGKPTEPVFPLPSSVSRPPGPPHARYVAYDCFWVQIYRAYKSGHELFQFWGFHPQTPKRGKFPPLPPH